MGDLMAPGGQVYEKIEGMAYLDGDIWIVNDNDAVDDNSGETQVRIFFTCDGFCYCC